VGAIARRVRPGAALGLAGTNVAPPTWPGTTACGRAAIEHGTGGADRQADTPRGTSIFTGPAACLAFRPKLAL
jgi:hypothetical protein